MQRRDFVKAMVAASMSARAMLGQQTAAPVAPSTPPPVPTAPGPVPWMRGLANVKPLAMTPLVPDAVAQSDAHFFSEQQMVTLRRLSEILMPPSKRRPGAIQAETPEFLDFLIGSSPEHRQEMYRSGLDWLDAEAKKRFDASFEKVNEAQADQLLRPWMRTWMNDHPPTELHAAFVNIAHSDIRTATINSQVWSEAEGGRAPDMGLYWFPIEPDVHRDHVSPMRTSLPGKRRI